MNHLQSPKHQDKRNSVFLDLKTTPGELAGVLTFVVNRFFLRFFALYLSRLLLLRFLH